MSLDAETLRQMVAEDEFGLLAPAEKRGVVSADQRLATSFQEITDFVLKNGRLPERNGADMTETRLAMRLKAITGNEEQASALRVIDECGLLGEAPAEVVLPTEPPESVEAAIANDPFGLLEDTHGLFELSHVPKPQTMPEQIARRRPTPDFEAFEALFEQCHADLRAGVRKLLPFKNPSQIEVGKFFVLNGVLLYVAEMGSRELDKIRKANARTRCIFENGTESDLLMQSLASNLYKDGRRVTESAEVTLERMGLEPNTKMGYVYVVRSLSQDEQLASFADAHKIGFTTRTIKQRTSGAERHPTFLSAPVEEVASYKLPAAAAGMVESILHKFFASARLDVWFDRDDRTIVEAKEWFDVPLAVIEEAVTLIENDTITSFEYDRDRRMIRLASV
jgi:T5orf172 domain